MNALKNRFDFRYCSKYFLLFHIYVRLGSKVGSIEMVSKIRGEPRPRISTLIKTKQNISLEMAKLPMHNKLRSVHVTNEDRGGVLRSKKPINQFLQFPILTKGSNNVSSNPRISLKKSDLAF